MKSTRATESGPTRREVAAALAGLVASRAFAQATSTTAPALDIAEWSYHWYGIERVTLARGTVCNGMQMYVERWIPAQVKHADAVVLIHGGYGQGSDWLSTPDGRRGWASFFIEQGFRVYIVDRPGQGRNPYQPFIHGNFDAQAQTFDRALRLADPGPQWPGRADGNDPMIAQLAASLGQPMGRNAAQTIWRSRGAMLLDDIGPAFFVTYGDGAAFASTVAQERPALTKGIIALTPLDALQPPAGVPAVAMARAQMQQATADFIATPNNGPLLMHERNNRETFAQALQWMARHESPLKQTADPHPNKENLSLKLADQGSFWIGVQRKKMSYGEIPMGQMHVQYMIPAEKKHPYPVVMTHGGGGQGTHMMGLGGRPGWVHYFVQAGYAVYWIDRPSYGRSPYHPDALGPSHLPNVPAYEGLLTSTAVFNTAQWPGPGGMDDRFINQFMACESGNVSDEASHSSLAWPGGAELLDKIGPSILFDHAFGGFFGWGVADRRPNMVKAIVAMEINGNPFAAQLRWGLTAGPMTYDPPVNDPSEFKLVDRTAPPDMPRPVVSPYKLQAEPACKWKNLTKIPIVWMTSEFGGGGSPVTNVEFLKQVGCQAEMMRLLDYGIVGNGNLMLLEKNNHEVFALLANWLDKKGVA